MRSLFPGYYNAVTTEETFWKEGLFVFDANILLNAYRYSEDARSKLLQAIEVLGERAFLPHQAALEFQRNRIDAIRDRRKRYSQATAFFDRLSEEVRKMSHADRQGASLRDDLDKAWKLADLEPGLKKATEYLRGCESKLLEPSLKDEIRDRIDQVFEGKVGPAPTDEQLKEWHADASNRVKEKIPPGYKDVANKGELGAQGDVLVWLQTIDCARKNGLPVVYVSDDLKEDWYWEIEGKKIGPRRELVEEMRKKADVEITFCDCPRFIERTWEILKRESDGAKEGGFLRAIVEEARSVQKETTEPFDEAIAVLEKLVERQEHYTSADSASEDISDLESNHSLVSNDSDALMRRIQMRHIRRDFRSINEMSDDNILKGELLLGLLADIRDHLPYVDKRFATKLLRFRSQTLDMIKRERDDLDKSEIVSFNQTVMREVFGFLAKF